MLAKECDRLMRIDAPNVDDWSSMTMTSAFLNAERLNYLIARTLNHVMMSTRQ
jgi:hypothetical protein